VRGRVRAFVCAGLAFIGGSARAQTAPAPPPAAPAVVPAMQARAKVVDFQLAAGFKRLPRDPVSGIMFGENGGYPQTSQLGLNASVIVTPRRWPIGMTFGVTYASSSRDRGYQETVSTTEIGSGVRKTFELNPVHAFVGAGWALGGISIRDDFSNGYETWNGAGSGGYLEGGGFIRLLSTVDLGLAVRYSRFWMDVGRAAPRYWDAGGFFAGVLVGVAP
jgi:hypothetical protein